MSYKSGTAGERPLRMDDAGNAEPVASITTAQLAVDTLNTTTVNTAALNTQTIFATGNVQTGNISAIGDIVVFPGNDLILPEPATFSSSMPTVTAADWIAAVTLNQRRGRVVLPTLTAGSTQTIDINNSQFSAGIGIFITVRSFQKVIAHVRDTSPGFFQVRFHNDGGGDESSLLLEFFLA